MEPQDGAAGAARSRTTSVLVVAVAVLAVAVVALGVVVLRDDDGGETRLTAADAAATSTTGEAGDTDTTLGDGTTVAGGGKPGGGGSGGGGSGSGGSGSGGGGGGTASTTSSSTTSSSSTSTTSSRGGGPPTFGTLVPQQLDFSRPPVFGSTALTSGFVPDPFQVAVTGGGPVNVNYLGGGCTGFATQAPTFSINYTAGAFPLLRFFFTGTGDTTMIVNAPSGSFFCVDDSFGTLHPTIDFNSPASGRYDVWIGTFVSGGSSSGTLRVTENGANHP